MSIQMSPLNGTSPTPVQHSAPSVLPDIPGLGGALAGLIGGIAMMITAAILSAALGRDMWLESRQIAAMFFGQSALAGNGVIDGAVIVGTIVHLVFSTLLGAVFGILSRRVLRLTSDFGTPVLVGLIYGMLIWMVAYFFVLPLVNPSLLGTYQPAFVIQNIVYGMVTGLVYTKLRPAPYMLGEPAR